MATTYTPRYEESGVNFTVSTDFSGSNSDTGRTYTLHWSSASIIGLDIVVAGARLQNATDFTFASNTVTFINAIYDDQKITINYNTAYAASAASTATYATTKELNEFMAMDAQIPNPDSTGVDRSLELVGIGDSSTTRFYTDNAYVIDGTYTFYYGSSETVALAQTLTETTHYTIDKDLGIVTLTTAGVTLVSTDNIYVAYSYNIVGFKDSELATQLVRAQDKVAEETNNHWADSTEDTPDYLAVSDEKQDGKGRYNRAYFVAQFPIPDVTTNLNGAVAIGDTTLTVDSTTGFPSSGTLNINTEKIVYSAKGASSFTVTAITAAHDDDAEVLPFVFEVSNTASGTAPTFTVLEKDTDYDLDRLSGRVFINTDNVDLSYLNTVYSPRFVRNRFRASYIWGNESIPSDITQLTLMIATQDLLHRAVRRAHARGLNDFNPDIVNVDQAWIADTILSYKVRRTSNV